jgi:hypothetical protein
MNWINMRVEFLQGEVFRGCEPTDRATWLCLLGYCHSQENRGVLVNCREWPDRKWQQVVAVTKEEVNRSCGLWFWDGDDLVVREYPVEKQAEISAKREAGKRRAANRWNTKENPSSGDSSAMNSASSSDDSSATSFNAQELDAEREGEGEDRERVQPVADARAILHIQKSLMTYCSAAEKRFSQPALVSAVRLVQSGAVSAMDLVAKLDQISEVARKNLKTEKRFLPSVYDLVELEQWRSPLEAFSVAPSDRSLPAPGSGQAATGKRQRWQVEKDLQSAKDELGNVRERLSNYEMVRVSEDPEVPERKTLRRKYTPEAQAEIDRLKIRVAELTAELKTA